MRLLFPFLIVLLVCSSVTNAQVTAITSAGDTIEVYDNGTWKPIKAEVSVTRINSTVSAEVITDEFSNSKKVTTEYWRSFAKNDLRQAMNGRLRTVNDLYVFDISYTGDLGCLSSRSTMQVKLVTGEIIEFTAISDADCGTPLTATFIPIDKELLKDEIYKEPLKENIKKLRDYDWETIRLNGSEYYTDLKPNKTGSINAPEQFFRQHIIAAEQK